MKIVVEKGVPLPGTSPRGEHWKVLGSMNVGESFFLPHEGHRGYAHTLAGNANRIFAPKRFASRAVDGGRRIWRVQ